MNLDKTIELELINIKKIDTAIALCHLIGERQCFDKIPECIHNDIKKANASIEDKSDLFSFDYTSTTRKLAINIFNKYKNILMAY